jgi:hypothetical protein
MKLQEAADLRLTCVPERNVCLSLHFNFTQPKKANTVSCYRMFVMYVRPDRKTTA